jgi:hypothetical protein
MTELAGVVVAVVVIEAKIATIATLVALLLRATG